jgi:hypothetical protein
MVDVSTSPIAEVLSSRIEGGARLHALVRELEGDATLFCPQRVHERLAALDRLDAGFGSFEAPQFGAGFDSGIHCRAMILQAQMEAANAGLCQLLRAEIVAGHRSLLPWLQGPASQERTAMPSPGAGFDSRDELLSGILQFQEPQLTILEGSPEMVPYQPTPARHVLHLIEAAALTEDDCFVDLGSGLGHVPLLVSMLTGIPCFGVEIQPAYVACARQCAEGLNLRSVDFCSEDARFADLSRGTVFYLYSPFSGSILNDVLRSLREESTRRPIRICSLGPCTRIIAGETWLKSDAQVTLGNIAVFASR